MAIVKQDMFVIRDKVLNILMEGAKGQMAFDTQGHARKSLVHTGWWKQYKKYDTVRKLMPNGNVLVDEYEHLTRLVNAEDWRTRDPKLAQAHVDVSNEINIFVRSNKEFRDVFAKIKFDNQSRFAVESLVSIETKEI